MRVCMCLICVCLYVRNCVLVYGHLSATVLIYVEENNRKKKVKSKTDIKQTKKKTKLIEGGKKSTTDIKETKKREDTNRLAKIKE